MEGNGRYNLYHFKRDFVREVLKKYEEAKEKSVSTFSVFPLRVRKKKWLRGSLRRGAKFERFILTVVDVERAINSLDEPYRTVIKKQYFEGDLKTLMRDLDLKSGRDAFNLIRGAINRFYERLKDFGIYP